MFWKSKFNESRWTVFLSSYPSLLSFLTQKGTKLSETMLLILKYQNKDYSQISKLPTLTFQEIFDLLKSMEILIRFWNLSTKKSSFKSIKCANLQWNIRLPFGMERKPISIFSLTTQKSFCLRNLKHRKTIKKCFYNQFLINLELLWTQLSINLNALFESTSKKI